MSQFHDLAHFDLSPLLPWEFRRLRRRRQLVQAIAMAAAATHHELVDTEDALIRCLPCWARVLPKQQLLRMISWAPLWLRNMGPQRVQS